METELSQVGDQGCRQDQEGTEDQEVPGPVARTRVATRRAPLTCAATVTPPAPSRDPRMCQAPAGLGRVGLYIGSVCNREGVFYFFAAPSPALSGAGGEGIFET